MKLVWNLKRVGRIQKGYRKEGNQISYNHLDYYYFTGIIIGACFIGYSKKVCGSLHSW